MADRRVFWVEGEFDLPPDIEMPKNPNVWTCDLGGFHNQPFTVGWRSLEPGGWVFEPFLLVREEVLEARFCNDCSDWLASAFGLTATQLGGGDDNA